MAKDIDAFFKRFSDIPDPQLVKNSRRGTRAISGNRPGSVTVIHPLHDNAPQYASIGKVAVEWANLEAMIDRLIWDLSGAPRNFAACITAQMIGPAPRLNALIAMCHEHKFDQAFMKELTEFKVFACGVGDQRNRMVHDSWSTLVNEVTGTRTVKNTITAKGKLEMKSAEVEAEEFNRLIFKIRRLADIFELHFVSKVVERSFENILEK